MIVLVIVVVTVIVVVIVIAVGAFIAVAAAAILLHGGSRFLLQERDIGGQPGIERGVEAREDEAALRAIGEEVKTFMKDYPMPRFC